MKEKFEDFQKMKFVAMLFRWVPENEKFKLRIILGIEQATGSNYSLKILNTAEKGSSFWLESILQKDNVSGILVMSYTLHDSSGKELELIHKLAQKGTSVVTIDNFTEDIDCVTTDNFQGAYQVTKEVLRKGCRRLAIITRKGIVTSRERKRGVEEALKESNISARDLFSFEIPDSKFSDEDYRDIGQVFQFKPDAIFAVDNEIAGRLIKIMEKNNSGIPEDILLCGFDLEDVIFPSGAEWITATQDWLEMGRRAMQLLTDRIEGRVAGKEVQKILIAPGIRAKGL